jgi:predicted permease
VLALGIGANSTIFSWINSSLLNPIPGISNNGSLVSLTRGGTAFDHVSFSYPDYIDLRDHNKSFSGLAAFHVATLTLTGSSKPERVWGALASANYFDVLGMHLPLGRGFLPAEGEQAGMAPVAVISYRLWQGRFGGSNTILGRTININRHPFLIVGVTPPSFEGAQTGVSEDIWVPLIMQEQLVPNGNLLKDRSFEWLFLIGRQEPGISIRQAEGEAGLLRKHIAEQFPEAHGDGQYQVSIYPLWRAPYGANRVLFNLLPMLMGITGLILLLACTNVANLLLVRSVTRRREVAIRLSVGATRWVLARQFLVESLLLSLVGGLLAMVLTLWTSGTLTKILALTGLPLAFNVRPNLTVIFVTFAISVITGIVFGTIPAIRSSKLAPTTMLKEQASSTSVGFRKAPLSTGLVVAQLALSLLLLNCAGLFIRSIINAQHFDPGFNRNHVLLASFDLSSEAYQQNDAVEFQRQILGKLKTIPGIQSVTLSTPVPLGVGWEFASVAPEGYVPDLNESMAAGLYNVGPDYFRTLEIPLLAGREFTTLDSMTSQPVAVVNQALTERYWPRQDPIGKRLVIRNRSYVVVGMARNSSYHELSEAPQPVVYLPAFQNYVAIQAIQARVSGNPLDYAQAVKNKAHELNPELLIYDVTTLNSQIQFASSSQRIAGVFAGAFGLLALTLAVVGLYGVIAYTTRQRSREIGIRMALGAQRIQVSYLILAQGLQLTAMGLAIGLVASFALTRLLRNLLFGVTASDSLTFSTVALLLMTVAFLACYLPAHRAAQVDPMIVLRSE